MTPLDYVRFTDGTRRPVYELPDGRQYVEDDYGCRIVGNWYIPREEWNAMFAEQPILVDVRPSSGVG